MSEFSDAELAAFLDEALPPERSSALEQTLRSDDSLRHRLIEVQGRQNAGLHTIGAIWRRGQLSCPTRSDLGNFLLGTLQTEEAGYISFHIETVGCRFCAANLDDLKTQNESREAPAKRRQRYFQTSAGYLNKK